MSHNLKNKQCEGYTLYCPAGPVNIAYLLDMDGCRVHEWSHGGQPVKMLPGGSIIGARGTRQGKDPLIKDPFQEDISPPPKPWQDVIELVQVDWEGNMEWTFSNWDDDRTGTMMSRQHHDFQREGNPVGYYAPDQDPIEKGRTLILAHKNSTIPEISDKEIEDDVIYEVDWDGHLTGFEWHAADHFEEMGFCEAAKDAIYKSVNFDEAKGFCDWLHINSMSELGRNNYFTKTGDERFNPQNIIISSRNTDYIAIISRKTGEVVWRVGPDFSEGAAEHGLGQFIGQHHAHMIPMNLPGEGNILVFDNGGRPGYGGFVYPRTDRRDYSRIIEFNPVTLEMVWQYGAEKGDENFFSHFISSAQRLPNGNTLITDGANGRLFEVTKSKETVWEFIAPVMGGRSNLVYRSYRIPPEWVPGNPCGYDEWLCYSR